MNNVTNTTPLLHPTPQPSQQHHNPQPTPFLCSLCPAPKYFTRKAHLERHIRTHHSVGSPLNCHFCGKEFRRRIAADNGGSSDLLKEHHIRCEFRGDRPIPVAVVGRKRRACDRCSQRKISCTGQIPCTRCINAGVVCEKTSPPADTSQLWSGSVSGSVSSNTPARGSVDSSIPEEEDDAEASGSDDEDDGTGSDPPDLRGSIEYLLNGRSHGNVAFVSVFDPGADEDAAILAEAAAAAAAGMPMQMQIPLPPHNPSAFDQLMDFTINYDMGFLPDMDINTLFDEMGFMMSVGMEPNLVWTSPFPSEHASPSAETDLDRYEQHARFLKPELEKVVVSFQLMEGTREYFAAWDALELITGDVLQRFTNSYFRNWHRHGTMIHHPTYSPMTCPTMLILAMSLIGGLYVKDQTELRRTRDLLDIAESYIYSRDYIRDEYEAYQPYPGSSPTESSKKTYEDVDWEDFQKLQAAYLVIVVQAWAGDRVAKRRTRQQRLSRVVELARQLRLPSAHHKVHPTNHKEWERWVRVESAIRLQNIMLTIDRAFIIFNNTSPRISLTEIEELDFPCVPASFNAASFEAMMALPVPPVRGIKVMRTLRMSFTSPLPAMPELTTFDLFILVHELYLVLAQDLSSQITPAQSSLTAMKQSIDWWIKAWKATRARFSDADFKALGLERTSDRYWVLVKALYLAFDKDIREGRRVLLGSRCDIDESGSHLKEFLAQRANLKRSLIESLAFEKRAKSAKVSEVEVNKVVSKSDDDGFEPDWSSREEHEFHGRSLDSRATSYWLANVAHGVMPFAPGGYKFYRNVRDYGAKGDGSSDDTVAINRAVSDGSRCGINCGSSSVLGALIYFPPGTYVISSPIIQYYYSQFVGDAVDRPIIRGSANFSGIALIDSDVYVPGGNGDEWYINQNQFYRQIRNFVLDLTQMQPSNKNGGQEYVATGIHWQVAQATSLQNIDFNMPVSNGGASSTKAVGIFMENGSGGFLSDLKFNGGSIGFRAGSQQFTARGLEFNKCLTAISMIWDWGFNWQDIKVSNCQIGLNCSIGGGIDGQGTGSLSIIDSHFINTPMPILTRTEGPLGPSIVIDNLIMEGGGKNVVTGIDGKPLLTGNAAGGSVIISSWATGRRYTRAGEDGYDKTGLLNPAPKKSQSLLDFNSGKWFTRSKPQYQSMGAGSFIIATDHGVKNDGTGDQTSAINNLLKGAKSPVFFPAGVYQVSGTVFVPVGTRMVGEGWSQIMGTGSYFQDANSPKVMVQVGNAGDKGVVEMSDFLFTVKGATAGAILVEWNVHETTQGSAAMWDCHFRVGGAKGSNLQLEQCPKGTVSKSCKAASMLLHITTKSSGYFENVWAWVADHDLDKATKPHETDTGKYQISVFSARGILIESQGPTWLYGTGSEHNVLYQYQLHGAKDVFLGHMQTETPYYQPSPGAPGPIVVNPVMPAPGASPPGAVVLPYFSGEPSFKQCAAGTGAGFYSFFENYKLECNQWERCQRRLVQTSYSEGIWVFNLFTKGAIEVVSPLGGIPAILVNSTEKNGYTTEISVWTPLGLTGRNIGGADDGSDGSGVVYIDPAIYADPHPTVFCYPPCTLIMPPKQLSKASTITFKPWTTTFSDTYGTVMTTSLKSIVTRTTVGGTLTTTTSNGIVITTRISGTVITTTLPGTVTTTTGAYVVTSKTVITPAPMTVTEISVWGVTIKSGQTDSTLITLTSSVQPTPIVSERVITPPTDLSNLWTPTRPPPPDSSSSSSDLVPIIILPTPYTFTYTLYPRPQPTTTPTKTDPAIQTTPIVFTTGPPGPPCNSGCGSQCRVFCCMFCPPCPLCPPGGCLLCPGGIGGGGSGGGGGNSCLWCPPGIGPGPGGGGGSSPGGPGNGNCETQSVKSCRSTCTADPTAARADITSCSTKCSTVLDCAPTGTSTGTTVTPAPFEIVDVIIDEFNIGSEDYDAIASSEWSYLSSLYPDLYTSMGPGPNPTATPTPPPAQVTRLADFFIESPGIGAPTYLLLYVGNPRAGTANYPCDGGERGYAQIPSPSPPTAKEMDKVGGIYCPFHGVGDCVKVLPRQ
ncbi:Glucan 1,3-beta-glucosidase [Drechslerella dactyloides]|uniref:Glucan 1,3-beta-glucosidase n=1 Tax=Drechslerella dactyloides TaxID=74499 RepID=A0AAD6J232_DREDA|nr:Glucan 1,3-beta-glucosidase [Drechslerella dactyloides]